MSLNLQQLWPEKAQGDWPQRPIHTLQIDSRQVTVDDVFFALKGSAQADRVQEFAQSALSKGAQVVFSEVELPELAGLPVYHVADIRQWIGVLALRVLQQAQPVQSAQVAAVTGTNGKTTISRLLAELLALGGQQVAVMGTTGNGILPNIVPSSHTTVDAIQLQKQLHDFAFQGASTVCLEASSHGLDQGRLAGTPIKVAIFTNLTRDHLDYHGTLEHYAAAKSRLFAFEGLQYAILNKDDPMWALMRDVATAQAQPPKVWTYSLHDSTADFYTQQIHYSLSGAQIKLVTPQGDVQLNSPLLGPFNVSNLLAVVAAAVAFGMSLQDIAAFVPKLQGAPGRMQVIADSDRLFVVDYAHTPDALTQVLTSLKKHVEHPGRLWAVFGCGGDRDRGKRPLMTQAALAVADQVLLTADNPRTESVEQILSDMQQGLTDQQRQQLMVESDRRVAIRQVVKLAQANDIVVLAGKGHETYQEIDGVRHWFDDVVELKAALGATDQLPEHYPA